MESLVKPFKIIISTLISFIGIMASALIFNLKFDIGGYASFFTISFFMFTVLIYLNSIASDKSPLYVSILKNSPIILLSGISIIAILIPFMVLEENDYFWKCYTICTIGGMLSSLINLFFIVPVYFNKHPSSI